jgi:hypothetical protein
MTGQNLAEETDSNTDFDSTSLGRARLYQGYLGLSEVAGSAYPGSAPNPTADGDGPMRTWPTHNTPDADVLQLDLGPGGSGAANQRSIEVTTPMADNDTYAAAKTMTPFFRPIESQYSGPSTAIAWGRSSEPSLEEERQQFRYRSVGMGFGMEAINTNNPGSARPKQVADLTLRWLLDDVTFGDPDQDVENVDVTTKNNQRVLFNANPFSSGNGKWVRLRWDFGDKSKFLVVDKNTRPGDHFFAPTGAQHNYARKGTYTVRVEALDTFGHVGITRLTVKVR